MIAVKMMGNIGNQMFIYAMARALQLKYNDSKIVIDLRGLKTWYYTANYKLDSMNLPNCISYQCSDLPFLSRIKFVLGCTIFHIMHFIIQKIRKYPSLPSWVFKLWHSMGCYFNMNRQYFDYAKELHNNKLIFGYFQSEKYFNEFKEQIIKDFTVISPLSENDNKLIKQMQKENSVAVSIRATKAPENPRINDNLKLGLIDKDYYYRGMKEIARRVENPVFYIFADDIDIVKEEYTFPYTVVYVSPKDSSAGIRLMYNCKHYVIANSTFSWWGAYLSRNYDNKLVVMPSVWDRFGPPRTDIYIGNAIKLDVKFLTE